MSSTKCVICNQKKAKRYCPAKAGLICSTCCGTKRVIEINCSSDCVYLASGREHRAEAVFTKQRTKMDPARQRKHADVLDNHLELLTSIQFALVAHRKSYRAMTDAEALEAITVLAKTYETETKGILYEHHSAKPEVQSIVRAVQEGVRLYRKENKGQAVTAQSALDCMEYMKDDIGFHVQEQASPTGYLDFVTLFFPTINKQADASRIILPGQGM